MGAKVMQEASGHFETVNAIGLSEAMQQADGSFNSVIAIGSQAMQEASGTHLRHIALGNESMYNVQSASMEDLIGIGYRTMGNFTGKGFDNIAIGYQAMQDASGWISNNIAIGKRALQSISGGDLATDIQNNVVIGIDSAQNLYNSSGNHIWGCKSAQNLRKGQGNIAVGYQALNTLVGDPTDLNIPSGKAEHCIALGNNADVSGANNEFSTVIGAFTKGEGSRTVVIGNAENGFYVKDVSHNNSQKTMMAVDGSSIVLTSLDDVSYLDVNVDPVSGGRMILRDASGQYFRAATDATPQLQFWNPVIDNNNPILQKWQHSLELKKADGGANAGDPLFKISQSGGVSTMLMTGAANGTAAASNMSVFTVKGRKAAAPAAGDAMIFHSAGSGVDASAPAVTECWRTHTDFYADYLGYIGGRNSSGRQTLTHNSTGFKLYTGSVSSDPDFLHVYGNTSQSTARSLTLSTGADTGGLDGYKLFTVGKGNVNDNKNNNTTLFGGESDISTNFRFGPDVSFNRSISVNDSISTQNFGLGSATPATTYDPAGLGAN